MHIQTNNLWLIQHQGQFKLTIYIVFAFKVTVCWADSVLKSI